MVGDKSSYLGDLSLAQACLLPHLEAGGRRVALYWWCAVVVGCVLRAPILVFGRVDSSLTRVAEGDPLSSAPLLSTVGVCRLYALAPLLLCCSRWLLASMPWPLPLAP